MSFKHGYCVGDGVHFSFNGDTYPGTVMKASETRLHVRIDMARGAGIFVPDPKRTELRVFTLRADGEFRSSGHGTYRLGRGRESHRAREN